MTASLGIGVVMVIGSGNTSDDQDGTPETFGWLNDRGGSLVQGMHLLVALVDETCVKEERRKHCSRVGVSECALLHARMQSTRAAEQVTLPVVRMEHGEL